MERITHHPKKKPPKGSRKLDKIFMLTVAMIVVATSALAQDGLFGGPSLDRRPFYVNVHYFRADDEVKTLTEVFVEIPCSSLRFVKTGVGYEAGVEVGVIFDDASGFQVDGDAISDTIRTDNFAATFSPSKTRLFCFRFSLEPGAYALRVVVDDQHANRRLSTSCKIEAPSFGAPRLKISSIQLAHGVEEFDGVSTLQKNGRIMIPNVKQIFKQESPSCLFYFEAYNLEFGDSAADSFQVHYSIRRGRKEVFSARENYLKPGSMAAVSVPLNPKILGPGEYVLTATVVERNGKEKSRASTQFRIIRSISESKDRLTLKSI
jgi:hypothetical protein